MASERTSSHSAAPGSIAQAPGVQLLPPDADALLCALVLAPNTYSRNRFFQLFELPQLGRVRRRAKRISGIIRQLLGHGRQAAVIISEQVDRGQVLMEFHVRHLNYQRTAKLSLLESALIHYALHKHQGTQVPDADRMAVETALGRLNQDDHDRKQES